MTSSTTERNRWAALYVLCAGMLMIVLDATIVNVALPSIQSAAWMSARGGGGVRRRMARSLAEPGRPHIGGAP